MDTSERQTLKTPARKRRWNFTWMRIAFWAVFLYGVLSIVLFLLPQPFTDSKKSLNAHLIADFGLTLPASATISHAQWLHARDREETYAVEMDPKDLAKFLDDINVASHKKHFGKLVDVRNLQPMYIVPAWWNNPKMIPPTSLDIYINDIHGHLAFGYGFLFSGNSGRFYIVWGEY